jgi:RNA polymerase sigma factor (sigma-70 family)
MSIPDNNIAAFPCVDKTVAVNHAVAHSMKDFPDAQLLWLTAQGERLAFECFYDRHERRIYNKALGKCRDIQLAGQLVQDVFVRLYLRVIDSDDPGKYQVGYLYSMLETAYIDYLRSSQERVGMATNDDGSADADLVSDSLDACPDRVAEQDDIIRMIQRPLLKAETLVQQARGNAEKKFALHRKKRIEEEVSIAMETFDQLYRYGYSMQEMATNLGLTLEQVKYRDKKLLDMVKAGFGKTGVLA